MWRLARWCASSAVWLKVCFGPAALAVAYLPDGWCAELKLFTLVVCVVLGIWFANVFLVVIRLTDQQVECLDDGLFRLKMPEGPAGSGPNVSR